MATQAMHISKHSAHVPFFSQFLICFSCGSAPFMVLVFGFDMLVSVGCTFRLSVDGPLTFGLLCCFSFVDFLEVPSYLVGCFRLFPVSTSHVSLCSLSFAIPLRCNTSHVTAVRRPNLQCESSL